MMETVKSVCKGAVMGIANIIPGVSGGTMAVSMGIYDTLIHAITHLRKEFKKSLKTVLPIGIGMAAGVLIVARLIEWLFARFPVQTNLFFIGLILGGIPLISGKLKGSALGMSELLSFFVFFALVIVMAILGEGNGSEADLSMNFITVLKLLGVGIIASATMVIPGVSGSMVLLLIGYYNPILSTVNAFVSALTAFDTAEIIKQGSILVPFGIGVVAGIFVIAKLIEMVLGRFPRQSFSAILGLIVASPIVIVYMNITAFQKIPFATVGGIMTIVTAVVAFVAGFFIAKKLA